MTRSADVAPHRRSHDNAEDAWVPRCPHCHQALMGRYAAISRSRVADVRASFAGLDFTCGACGGVATMGEDVTWVPASEVADTVDRVW